MGRPRATRKDLPPGLYWDALRRVYFFRRQRGDSYTRVAIGRVDREQAIREWVKLTANAVDPAGDGTVAEILDDYATEELPSRVKRGKMTHQATADEYVRQLPVLRKEFGAKKFALTAAESGRHDVLRTVDVDRWLRGFEGRRGAAMANRMAATLSSAFAYARRAGVCTYNPCVGAERNREEARKNVLADDVHGKLLAVAHPALRLMAALSSLTSMRKTDARLLMRTQVDDREIHVTPSKTRRKTGKKIDFAITPAVRAVLDEAKTLPGRKISLYIFPTRKGTPYSESGLQSAMRRSRKKAGLAGVDATFRDLRTTELNAIHREGGDATGQPGTPTSAPRSATISTSRRRSRRANSSENSAPPPIAIFADKGRKVFRTSSPKP